MSNLEDPGRFKTRKAAGPPLTPPAATGGKPQSPPWRLNRRRTRWFLAGLALAGLAGMWFCWLQPPGPVGPPRARWWAPRSWVQPIERNAHRRLALVPSVSLNGCFFTNHLGWVVGDSGVILHTRDGGRSWQVQTNIVWGEMPDARTTRVDSSQGLAAQTSGQKDAKADDGKAGLAPVRNPNLAGTKEVPPDYEQGPPGMASAPATGAARPRAPQDLNGVWFADERLGWAVGALGTILHTTDGGQSWAAQSTDTAEVLGSVTFVDTQKGWVVGSGGALLRTDDGGRTWTTKLMRQSGRLVSITFVDAQRGWMVEWGGTVLHTTDGGQSWTNQLIRGGVRLDSIAFANAERGWIAGSEGTILHTADGGQTWNAQFTNRTVSLSSVSFVDARHGWAVGMGGRILHTANGGETWSDQPSNTKDYLRAVRFVDARRGWAVGGEGTILRTTDGGRTWTACTANVTGTLATLALEDDRHAWAAGEHGVLLRTEDGGVTWTTHSAGTDEILTALAFPDARRGWLAGWNGTLRQTLDGGQNWQERSLDTLEDLWALTFADEQRAWIVGGGGTILHSADGGQTWSPQTSGVKAELFSVAFADASRGWVAGENGTILATADGGQTWTPRLTGQKEDLRRVVFVDAEHGWAVGRRGTILHTSNGGQSWAAQRSGTEADLFSAVFVNVNRGWVVGAEGTILSTRDGGQTWQEHTSATRAYLATVSFLDERQGWAAGSGGVVLRTTDGGQTWSDPRRYRRYPAPLFYPSLLAAGFLAWWGFRRPDEDQPGPEPVRSIADHAVSDRPLTSRDYDALNFGPLAEGIANYLRNEKTTGPLTLAITGDWGSGKSSLMGLLKEKLEAHGFRPVWFNAWHHQQEEQLLAALLDSIRRQAVPSWLSLAGVQFRIRLISERLKRGWGGVLLGTAACAMLAAVIANLGSDWKAWIQSLADSSWPVLAGKLAVAAGALAALFKGVQGLKAFGVDPARLLASVTDKARLSDLGAQTSFRHRFAQEFREVTTALQPRTMTVFIDDLDRCEPAQVMQVMQALNFLSSSGECFLVVGMEEAAVTNCVAVSLKEQFDVKEGRELAAEDRVRRRWEYAQLWMEKLIQIRIPVPSPNDTQFKALLTGAKPAGARTEWAGLRARLRARAAHGWQTVRPIALSAAVVVLAAGGYYGVDRLIAGKTSRQAGKADRKTVAPVAWSSNSVIGPERLQGILLESPQGLAGTALLGDANFTNWVATQRWTVKLDFEPREFAAAAPKPETPVTLEPAPPEKTGGRERGVLTGARVTEVQKGQTDHSGWWLAGFGLLALVIFGGKRLVEQFNQQVQDSEDFRDALARWSEHIGEAHPTPRAAKRLVNKLRFYAMVMRALRGIGVGADVPENAIVAFGALEEQLAKGVEPLRAQYKRPRETTDSNKQAEDVMALEESLARHPELFRYLRVTVGASAAGAGSVPATPAQ